MDIHNPTLQRIGVIAALVILVGAITLVSINLISSSRQKTRTTAVTPTPVQPVVVEPKTYELEVSLDEEDITPAAEPSSPASPVSPTDTPPTASPSPTVIAQVQTTAGPTQAPTRAATSTPTKTPAQDLGILPQAGTAQYSGIVFFSALLFITLSFIF